MITNRSSFSGLYIARSGIVTAQGNLDVTGQNITNINTNGYTRQRLDIRSIGDSGYKSKYSNQGVKIGYGVEATGIQQLRDASLDARYRTENAEYGYEDVFVSGLNDLQGILDESINEGLQAQLSEVMTSFESLLSDASGAEYINVVKNNIQLVNKLFNEISGNVETIFRQNVEDLQMEVDNVNMILEKIANLNDLIRTDKLVGNSALELMDERNLLLDELSGIMDIRYQVDAEDYEAMSIYLMDSNGNKHILVDNEDFVEFELRPSADEIGRGTNISINIKNEEYTYTYAENGAILTQDKNEHYIETVPPTQSIYVFGDDMENGSLGAYLDLLNADGDPENRGIEYYMERLDTLANTFAKMINDINRGSLFDANGKLQITEDHLQEILSSDNQYLYTENGDVFDMDLLREAVFGTADIFPKYFMDENGVLLKDAAGEYISAKAGSIYLGTDGKYYTKKTPGYDLAFPKVNLADENIEAARVYNNGKDYISEKQYKALQNLDKDSYHQIMDEFKVSANLPAEYVRFQYGTSGKAHLLKDYNGDYVAVNDDGTLPTIYEITVSGQEEVEYCTADQLATYTAAKEAAGITFSAKELDSKKVIGARVYDDGNGNYLIDGEFSLLQDEFENYQSVTDEYYADANGNLIIGYGGGYVKATDANGNLLTIFQDKDNPAAGVYFTQAERAAYLASRVTFAQSTTHSWVNAYSDGENIITADVYNAYSAKEQEKFNLLPNQYAVDNTGAFLQDINGGYIRQNIIYNDDGTIDHYDTPVVFLGSDGYYYTEDVKDAYIANTTEFEQVPAASLAATKVYDGNGKLITETEYNVLKAQVEAYENNGLVMVDKLVDAKAEAQYVVDAQGNLLRDFEGNYIPTVLTGAALVDGQVVGGTYEVPTLYVNNGYYYTADQWAIYKASHPTAADVLAPTGQFSTSPVYDNGNQVLTKEDYDAIAEGNQLNYSIVTIKPTGELNQIASQYVVDQNGEFIKDYTGNYILADSTKSPQVPAIYMQLDKTTGEILQDASGLPLYYTEEQKDKYLTANPGATEAEFAAANGMGISRMYEAITDTTVEVTKEVKFIGDSNGDLLRDVEGNLVTTTDGTIPELYTSVTVTDGNGVVTAINGVFTSKAQVDAYVAAHHNGQTIDYGINHNNNSEVSLDGNYKIITPVNYISKTGTDTALQDVEGNYFVGVKGQLPTMYSGVVISDGQGGQKTVADKLFSSKAQADAYVQQNHQGYTVVQYGSDGIGDHGDPNHAYNCAIFEVMDDSIPITITEQITVQEKQYINENDYNGLSVLNKELFTQLKEEVPELYLYSTDKNLLNTNDNTEKITAGNITISKEWMKDDKVLLNSIKQHAATGDNDNIQRFITVFSDSITFHSDKYGDMFKGTMQGCSSNIMTTVGLDINIHTSLATSYETNLNSINSNRMAVSSVDENEETANLMMYQKAFQASSRVMTTVDEMLDKLINATGMVGR